MTDAQERRDPQTHRKPVSTLVEVCGNIPGIPVFEAESVDVSSQGMHLRTAYLPEAGAPLVCRFESDGREIVVEGMVAWRQEGGRGGEFGIKFTALDSRSVDALKSLCGASPNADPKSEAQLGETGARVRLHIEGLGSPMKARVKSGGSAKVQVGSSLEFLKVGKRLELEDLDLGARRSAEIDGVSVIIDPSTRIPQLVVALRFEGSGDSTPSPSVADVAARGEQPKGLRIPASAVSTDAGRNTDKAAKAAQSPSVDEDEDDDESEPEMRGRLASMAASAEGKAKAASETLARASSGAAKGAWSLLKNAGEKFGELRRKRATPARRTTSPAPSSSQDKPKLRQQSAGAAPAGNDERRLPRRTLGIAAGASITAIGALALALRAPSAPPPSATHASAELIADSAAGPAAPNAVGAPLTPPAGAAAMAAQRAAGGPAGAVTANVPLFGPTPLATTEPAPLGPPPGTNGAGIEAAEKADAKASLAPAMNDESFPEEADEGPSHSKSSEDKNSSSAKNSTKPEDVSPWGHGKMHEPIIYRLRLDGPGAKLVGSQEPTGFSVVIPARKVMESAAGLGKRDPRIARVKSSNGDAGALLSFRFKD
jgi:hypothetical protein